MFTADSASASTSANVPPKDSNVSSVGHRPLPGEACHAHYGVFSKFLSMLPFSPSPNLNRLPTAILYTAVI